MVPSVAPIEVKVTVDQNQKIFCHYDAPLSVTSVGPRIWSGPTPSRWALGLRRLSSDNAVFTHSLKMDSLSTELSSKCTNLL